MAIYELDGRRPEIHPSVFVAESASVIGNVSIGEGSSIWFGTVIRGDGEEPIRIGRRTSIQDLTMLHADHGQPCTIGDDVTVGHQVMLHGCTVHDGALIGIGAIVLNGAVIGAGSIVGAGSVVTEGKIFPERSLLFGAPAKVVRELTPEQAARAREGAAGYVVNGARFARTLKRVG
jgi:carbonic anhydrase/acetyltransferase-like protein (isoleucine patch superfamily)